MTEVAIPTPGGALAVPAEETGLEDFDIQKDAVVPRLTIDHVKGVFIDSLSKVEYPKLRVVLLGLVKQRIMWGTDVKDDAQPLCKSVDFNNGIPNIDSADFQFPWPQSGFDPSIMPREADGAIILPCNSCPLKEWGTDPKGGKAPWCGEQHTFPLLMDAEGDGSIWLPALFTVQRTSIKPSKVYLTAFARTKTPTYTKFTNLSLRPESRGAVRYSVVEFSSGGATEEAAWGDYAISFKSMREFIRSRPTRQDDSGPTGPTETAPVVPPSAPVAAPVAAPLAPPVAAPVVTAPVAAPPAPAPVPAPVPQVTAPVPQVVAPTPVSEAAAAAEDDLPF